MAYMDIRDPREYNVIPIHHIRIGIAGGGDFYYNLEDGSEWKFAPVEKQTDRAGARIVAFVFEGTFIVLQNDYQNMLDGFRHLIQYKPSDFDLFLAPGYSVPWREYAEGNSQELGNFMQISVDTSTTAPFVKDWHGTFSLSENKESPRLIIKIRGVLS